MKLIASIVLLVQEGSRNLKEVMEFADFFQIVKDRSGFFADFKAFLASRALGAKSETAPFVNFASIWRQVYVKLGIKADFWDLAIEYRPGYWPIVVYEDMTPQKVMNAIKGANLFLTWQYATDLDAAITKNDRDPKTGFYVVYVKASQEADPEFKNLSANQLKKQNIKGITLLERILLEVFHFILSDGQHLDIQSFTLCSGSWNSYGNVPHVSWHDGKMDASWHNPERRADWLRSRVVVS